MRARVCIYTVDRFNLAIAKIVEFVIFDILATDIEWHWFFFGLFHGPFRETTFQSTPLLTSNKPFKDTLAAQVHSLIQWSSRWRLANQSQHCWHTTQAEELYAQTTTRRLIVSRISFLCSTNWCYQTRLGKKKKEYWPLLWALLTRAISWMNDFETSDWFVINCNLTRLLTVPIVYVCMGVYYTYIRLCELRWPSG